MVKLGVLGTGRMARTMVQAATSLSDWRVTAVGSQSSQRAQQFTDHVCPHARAGDYEAVLQDPHVDAVYLANRTADHARWAQAALAAGKPLLCEKPLATSFADAEATVELARQHRQLLVEAVWTQCLPSFRRVAELVAAQTFGRPIGLHADFGYPLARDAANVPFLDASGGVVWDRAIYLVNLAIQILGPVDAVLTTRAEFNAAVCSHVEVVLRHRNGASSTLVASFQALQANRATLYCEAGAIELQPPLLGCESIGMQGCLPGIMAEEDLTSSSPKSRLLDRLRGSGALRKIHRRRAANQGESLSFGRNPYHPLLQHFAQLVSTQAGESELLPLDITLQTHRVLELIPTAHTWVTL